ncbi:MAG: helicase c2 [Verrucomicrobia bacterium]|nr:helicase c2 [Verrucomicrobiota bacterium]
MLELGAFPLMDFNLDRRTASLSVGEFSAFTTGPHDAGEGAAGLWRAQLGTHWHNELRLRATDESPGAEFEIPVTGQIFHAGWTLTLAGRIDQRVKRGDVQVLREIKTVTRPLPEDESVLRADYPSYFVQLATYVSLLRPADGTPAAPGGELVFVETGSGLAQTVLLLPTDDRLLRAQLERIVEFLNLRLRARARLRALRFRPAFTDPRPGQETTQAELTAVFERQPLVLFEAPTGFGKTGVLLEFALGQLKSGHFDRALYLTSKSTGQLQVVRTLAGMTGAPSGAGEKFQNEDGRMADPTASILSPESLAATTAVAVWHVRNKAEHCVNSTFHCVRESCGYLDQLEKRWPGSGLSRFYLFEHHARDLETLRSAGRDARICPYEITRASLAFNDVWIGDYNYVFAPRNRSLFYQQPGFDPARTLLLLDEAHNLPSRVADAHSHLVRSDDARAVLAELDHLRVPASLLRAWESWAQLLAALQPVDALDPALEADVEETVGRISDLLLDAPVDYAALGPQLSEVLWQTPQLREWLADARLRKLLWCPRAGELSLTCLDAAEVIGATLRDYGGVVLASATLLPAENFAEACGIAEGASPTADQGGESGEFAAVGNSAPRSPPAVLLAHTPWRDGAYDVAVDARVDTTFHHRSRYYAMTAETVAALHASARNAVAVFFPSYAYAEAVARALEQGGPGMKLPHGPLRVALQPRQRDLAAQTAWVEESLAFTDALFLVLGSSFAEGIDALGGRVTHAMVVGPALPEVNAVQRARLAEFSGRGREAAFRRVYQIPGMTKVNQALGRLVRAPGQRARVILHCRRFAEPAYASLLARDYQFGTNLLADADLAAWLAL